MVHNAWRDFGQIPRDTLYYVMQVAKKSMKFR